MTTQPAGQPPLSDLLGLFAQLNIDGVDGHDYVDYLIVKYRLACISDLKREQVRDERDILNRMIKNTKIKEEFRIYLLGIQAKLKEYGSWEVMKYVKIDIHPKKYYRGGVAYEH